ncbi:MAG: hypothetical protein KDE08_02570 [Rhodobacteraceae bacterium]|nr:hypothetical protein [Paracoccaceae bacterium]
MPAPPIVNILPFGQPLQPGSLSLGPEHTLALPLLLVDPLALELELELELPLDPPDPLDPELPPPPPDELDPLASATLSVVKAGTV